tara:strand:- start:30998 stop:32224 length:1227 start_codon:yes stop_codon:yes gene_type:complete
MNKNKIKAKFAWRFGKQEEKYVKEVLKSGFASSTSGNMNTRLEESFAKIHNQKFAITFNSGTTTLHASLEALGVGYGDEVLVTPLTVISCMNSILYCNAIPVFVDVDPETFLMDPEDLKRKITTKTKGIMAVHLYGQVCNMTEILKIAKKNKLFLLEDCAQCFLGKHNNILSGTFGDVASWSFENSKHMTTGDGGIITTNNENLGDKIRKYSTQGFRNATAKSGKIRISKDIFQNPNYSRHSQFGYMYRLPEVAAAIGLAQLEKLDKFVNKRIKMAKMYNKVINDLKCDWIKPQLVPKNDINSYYTYAFRLINAEIKWSDFRKKYVEYGGDGIYAAWKLCYLEDSISDIMGRLEKIRLNKFFKIEKGICPVAEKIQPQIMQLTTNQNKIDEMKKQADCLYKTIKYFNG